MQYTTSTQAFRVFAVPIAVAGVVVCLQGVRLVLTQWPRSRQLATTTATLVILVLPFELYPGLHVLIQEWYAVQTVALSNLVGVQPALERAANGHLTMLRFDNGGFLEIVRECNGVYAAALFSAIVVGARASLRRKLGGLAFVLVVVFLVNQLRMMLVAVALAHDWFGPLITDTNTVQTTYYVAELGMGQSVVVVASIGGFLLLGRWLPDMLAFVGALLDEISVPSRG